MKLIGKPFLYQATFPPALTGKTGDVYYTIYNANGSVYTAKTQAGVNELGAGSYGVVLTFNNAVTLSIYWEMEGTPYVASETINIYDDAEVFEAIAL